MPLTSARRPTPITGPTPAPATGERRGGRGMWLGARTRNALRRTGLIATVGGATFLVALLTLVLVPRQANRRAQAVAPRPEERPDTVAAVQALVAARARREAADRTLGERRQAAVRLIAAAAPPVDTFSPELRARRESLAARLAGLNRLVARVEDAPLPASYRALGESPELAGDARVRVLLDSLGAIERERAALDAVGGVDPIFIALTSRAAELGRSIRGVADARRAAIRREYLALRPAAPPAPPSTEVVARADTTAALQRVVAAQQGEAVARSALATTRQRAAAYAAREAQARSLASVGAPPFALLAASVVIGVAVAFAAALLEELRGPRVADSREAERVTDARVLAVIRDGERAPERNRRRSDHETPPLIETASDSYRMLYLSFAATGAPVPNLTVTGDDPAVVATVAANLAAASASDARSTLIVDGDPGTGAVAGVFRLRADPGYADVLRGVMDWAGAIVSTHVGRQGTIDVVPSGTLRRKEVDVTVDEQTRADFGRLVSRYDLSVLVLPLSHAERQTETLMPSPDTIICVRTGRTRLRTLAATRQRLAQNGLSVVGLVMWDAEPPSVPTRESLSAGRREPARADTRRAAVAR